MDFDFSPEQYMFQESVRTFLAQRFDGAKVRARMSATAAANNYGMASVTLGYFPCSFPRSLAGSA